MGALGKVPLVIQELAPYLNKQTKSLLSVCYSLDMGHLSSLDLLICDDASLCSAVGSSLEKSRKQ